MLRGELKKWEIAELLQIPAWELDYYLQILREARKRTLSVKEEKKIPETFEDYCDGLRLRRYAELELIKKEIRALKRLIQLHGGMI